MFLLVGCGTTAINYSSTSPILSSKERWAVLPMTNHTETPQAGSRVSAIITGLLRIKGVNHVSMYRSKTSCDKLITCPGQMDSIYKIKAWAKQKGVRYIMLGSVNEWHYKVGLDGEPVVNVVLKLMDIKTHKTIWSAVGSKTGNSRSGLSNVGQELIEEMLSGLRTY